MVNRKANKIFHWIYAQGLEDTEREEGRRMSWHGRARLVKDTIKYLLSIYAFE